MARAAACCSLVLLLMACSYAPMGSATRLLTGEPDTPDAPVGPADLAAAGAEAVGEISGVTPAAGLADQLLSRYLSNAELAAWGADFVARCPSISRRFSIGKSVQGNDLWVVEIAAAPGVADGKPNFKYVANMHGDEPGGRVLLPMLAEWLCANAATDPRAQRIIQGMHLFLMPTMNPDGFARRTRSNGAGSDLNRNFPSVFFVCAGQAPETCPPERLQRASGYTPQPETLAMMAWTLATPFTASANLHEGAIVANFPWDGYNDRSTAIKGVPNLTPDTVAFRHLSATYAAAHGFMSRSNSFGSGITNGAAWYPIYGSMQDWVYTAAGSMDITLELSQQKYPPTSYLPTMWRDNLNALVALPINAVLGGVNGRVTDAASGGAVAGAVVSVDGISTGVKARSSGAFTKPLAPGSYTVRVSAPGFKSASATIVVPADASGATINFSLVRATRLAARRAVGPAAALVVNEAAPVVAAAEAPQQQP